MLCLGWGRRDVVDGGGAGESGPGLSRPFLRPLWAFSGQEEQIGEEVPRETAKTRIKAATPCFLGILGGVFSQLRRKPLSRPEPLAIFPGAQFFVFTDFR